MQPRSALLLPPPHLSSCIFAAILRDTRGAQMNDTERLNHFPASPLVSLTYVISGTLWMLPTGAGLADLGDATEVTALTELPPQQTPVSSWSPGPVAVVTLGFYPDAWLKLTNNGAAAAVKTAMIDTFGGFQQTDDFEMHWSRLTKTIGAIWQEQRATGGLSDWAGSNLLADWSRSMVGRAALAGPGRSMRAFERKLRRWSQQSRQSLKFYSDIENLHRISTHQKHDTLAGLATDAGYADQSHMGRALRRATGFTPAQLNNRVDKEEAFWCYRLLGERF